MYVDNNQSKLKELSRRTTFIRVTNQLNEIFGSKDEGKTATPPTTSTTASSSSSSSSCAVEAQVVEQQANVKKQKI